MSDITDSIATTTVVPEGTVSDSSTPLPSSNTITPTRTRFITSTYLSTYTSPTERITTSPGALIRASVSIKENPGWRSLFNNNPKNCFVRNRTEPINTYDKWADTIDGYTDLYDYLAHITPAATTSYPNSCTDYLENGCFCRFEPAPTIMTQTDGNKVKTITTGNKEFESALSWMQKCGKKRCNGPHDCDKPVEIYASYCATAMSVVGGQDMPNFPYVSQNDMPGWEPVMRFIMIGVPIISIALIASCVWCCCCSKSSRKRRAEMKLNQIPLQDSRNQYATTNVIGIPTREPTPPPPYKASNNNP